ncbi:MAG TPA: response regulator [Chloroflexia bacterium]|nr:response regulator [Chloroflexia bacterium]
MSKILIVDDEPTIVELLEEHLRSEGYDTAHAYSGEEALQSLGKNVPDLVILDLMLPGMDGYEVCRLMQQDPRLNHIPVIMLTARSAVPNKVLGYQRGADDYVLKPFDPEELSVRVRAQLHHLYHDTVAELTGLPGAQAVEDIIRKTTADHDNPWAIIYVDVANATAYNEAYTFIEGDELIKVAGEALTEAVKESGNANDFVGHMGGDKFVVVTRPEHVQGITSQAQSLFAEHSQELYSPTDRHQGYMVTMNHQGLLSHVKLCSLDFDVVSSEDE